MDAWLHALQEPVFGYFALLAAVLVWQGVTGRHVAREQQRTGAVQVRGRLLASQFFSSLASLAMQVVGTIGLVRRREWLFSSALQVVGSLSVVLLIRVIYHRRMRRHHELTGSMQPPKKAPVLSAVSGPPLYALTIVVMTWAKQLFGSWPLVLSSIVLVICFLGGCVFWFARAVAGLNPDASFQEQHAKATGDLFAHIRRSLRLSFVIDILQAWVIGATVAVVLF